MCQNSPADYVNTQGPTSNWTMWESENDNGK